MFSAPAPAITANCRTIIADWRTSLAPAIDTLSALAGTTEDEFLQIGARLQDYYLRSSDITAMANRLVESVSGGRADAVISRLRRIMADMDAYLADARDRSHRSCDILSHITSLLDQVSRPLESFQKMTRTLRMLGISTKIESSRLGETGIGFQTLALDVERLSRMVSEKSACILGHRQVLVTMINDNLRLVRSSEAAQGAGLSNVLSSTARTLEQMIAVNTCCVSSGAMISSISGEVSANIGEVVSSMQMHDMTRQQVEHIVEALRRLILDLEQATAEGDDGELLKKLVIEAGDVCELQSAQLRYASQELCNAVASIVGNLRDVAGKQSSMAAETLSATGGADSTGGSFIDSLRGGLSTVTGVLASCARSDHEMAATLQRAAETIQEIAGFVADIEEIGAEIDLIALNAQIKAALTGDEGAALGVLAEAIKRLSVDAVNQTTAVSEILLRINDSTAHLIDESPEEAGQQGTRIANMEHELGIVLEELGMMNDTLMAMLSGLGEQVEQLTGDIGRTTGDIDVHSRVTRMAGEVESALDRVVEKARELEPASTEFKENLRHMEQCYTMESERKIHDSIARQRGFAVSADVPMADAVLFAAACEESEFGDNVDLF